MVRHMLVVYLGLLFRTMLPPHRHPAALFPQLLGVCREIASGAYAIFGCTSYRGLASYGTPMMETENFTIFIKNSIRFPTFNYTKGNFLPNITKKYISECNFDMVNNTYCPIFRVGDVVRYAQQNFTNLAEHVQTKPVFAKYFKMENGTDYRTLVKAYAIRFDVLVNGNAGKFNMIPTLINMVAAFTSVGVGTVLCDIILLNFLKGAEQYKAKKFEE
ncbi:P2X purinoceptor 3-like, partial [Pundamilia nyererei]|uniref:P2X purinoceptor 3-like n=1 Tax=Pundamilia nyererei TaxID=303518 RepID=A0A9Y3W0Z1_9CICH